MKHKTEHPNRPVDLTVALRLKCGAVLHKGECSPEVKVYYGDHKHTRYIVGGILFQVKIDKEEETRWVTANILKDAKFSLEVLNVELMLVNELSMEPTHVRLPELLQYHRVEDCASHKRRPPNNKPPRKPLQHQQIVVGKNSKPLHYKPLK